MARKNIAAHMPLEKPAPTPLAMIVGFEVAEETYDLLSFREQLIVDLLICEYSQADIATVLGVSNREIFISVQSIRVKLANSKLKNIIELREIYRNNGRS